MSTQSAENYLDELLNSVSSGSKQEELKEEDIFAIRHIRNTEYIRHCILVCTKVWQHERTYINKSFCFMIKPLTV